MSTSSVGSGSAYNYLQSIVAQQTNSGKTKSPIETLMAAFYPSGDSSNSSSTTTAASDSTSADATGGGPPFDSSTFGALISLQGADPLAAKAQSLFAGLDSNGDGSVSKSEFESAFGANADTSKVDGLFNALDSNGDGSVRQGELTSAMRDARAHHHHHGDGGGGGGLDALLSATSGANSKTVNNADGSTTTTITYADGSSIAMNTPAAASTSDTSSGGSGKQSAAFNMLEKLIQMQAQLIGGSSDTSLIASV
jgi:hypothetical protein